MTFYSNIGANMNESLQAVHRVLEYLLTKAALTGQLKGTTVRIPYNELMAGVGQTKFRDTDLIVKIDFEWDEARAKVKTPEPDEMDFDDEPGGFDDD
jgi:hypothetical protein